MVAIAQRGIGGIVVNCEGMIRMCPIRTYSVDCNARTVGFVGRV